MNWVSLLLSFLRRLELTFKMSLGEWGWVWRRKVKIVFWSSLCQGSLWRELLEGRPAKANQQLAGQLASAALTAWSLSQPWLPPANTSFILSTVPFPFSLPSAISFSFLLSFFPPSLPPLSLSLSFPVSLAGSWEKQNKPQSKQMI